ncbi:RNA pseudouridine synthase [Clostridia bacterium]|nr:RNA pseudouridine synthase [Clostridia bacterium]
MQNFDIMYEDNHVIVAVKPANMPTQEDASGDPDFLNAVKAYLVEKYRKPGAAYLGLIHRLDRPASGVMVFAKTDKAAGRLSETVREGGFEKKYFAVVLGTPQNPAGKLVHFLLKDEQKNNVSIVPSGTDGAKRAELDYKALKSADGFTLVDIDLLTGRSHQARVQMNSMRTPIYGDVRYGGQRAAGGNLALFAYSLRFPHPVTKKTMVFKACPPVDTVPWNSFKATIDLHIETSY